MSADAATADIAGAPDRRWLALAVITVSQFMVVLDTAIVNVALPSIRSDLHFSQENLQWVITGYAICFGGLLLLGGRLADLLGRRLVFMAGILVFTIFSLLDGLAWSEASLITFRCLQGLGAALVSPAALSILTTTFQEGGERNKALGIWGAASGSGGAVGALLGGALTSGLSWSWIFYVNVPIGALVLAASPRLLRESRAEVTERRFDFAGAVAITGGLMLLVYAMTHATQHGWVTAATISVLVASAVLIASFFVIEARAKAPLLPLRILRMRTLAGSNVCAFLTTFTVVSMFLLLTLYMQEVLHYSAIKTGVAYIPQTLTLVFFSAIGQSLVTRRGVRRIFPVGLVLAAVSFVLFTQLPTHGHYFADLFPGFLISGPGLAFAFVSMSIGALTGVQQADAGIASGLINTTQQVGGAIGVAVAITVATTATNHYVSSHHGATAFDGAALTHGFTVAFWVLAVTAAIGALLAALTIESQPSAGRIQPAVAQPVLAPDSA
jgi:EmrB/QacA subfamily drug resistance transporter